MKIYTKKGDDGTTALFGGARLDKDDLRIEAYGTIDELNSFLGQLADLVSSTEQTFLREIQRLLFNIGSSLATAPNKESPVPLPTAEDLARMEQAIDQMETELSPLKNFILPGGHPKVSAAHVCRTVCRRAERRIVSLARESIVQNEILPYLNRLSDYFFVYSRKLSRDEGVEEIPWIAR